MTEAEKLHEGKDFIAREVQKKGTGRIDELHWEQNPTDQVTRIHRLVVFQGGEKSIFTFTEYELLEDYGSRQWEKQMRSHVGEILMEF